MHPPLRLSLLLAVACTALVGPTARAHDHRPPGAGPAHRPLPEVPPDAPVVHFRVPPDRVPPRGLCRIWFDGLPADRQPASMSCRRAHRLARGYGGRVIWADRARARKDGEVAAIDYGRVDLDGVPPDRLPPPGLCRIWLDDVPADRQPPPRPCPEAQRDADDLGGRLLYMPGADAR